MLCLDRVQPAVAIQAPVGQKQFRGYRPLERRIWRSG